MLTAITPVVLALKEARERASVTQAELAEAVGVLQATISGPETGKGWRIELDFLEKLAVQLDVDVASLIAEQRRTKRRGGG